MKRYTTIIAYCLLHILFSCKAKPGHLNAVTGITPKKDSIVLINKVTNSIGGSLYNIDLYEKNVFPMVFKAGSPIRQAIPVTTQIFILSNDNNKVFFLNPGERVDVSENPSNDLILSVNNNQVRTNELSFFYDLNKKYPQPNVQYFKASTINDIKKTDSVYNAWYLNACSFLNAYNKSKAISRQFILTAGKYLYYMRLANFLKKIYRSPNAANFIKEKSHKKFPECDSCLAMPHYRFASYYYNKILTGEKTTNLGPFTSEYDTADTSFTGTTKKYLLYSILSFYINTNIHTPPFDQRMHSFLAAYPQDTLSKFFKFNYSLQSAVYASLNGGSALDEMLITANSKLIKWKDVLLNNKGKVIVIDFWARYCGPCVHEIPFSQTLEKGFENKNVAFIYVSCDQSKASWTEGMDQLHFKNRQNSYLISTYSKSNIGKYYQLKYIPKYVVYNKKGNMVNSNAPRPSDPALKTLLNKLTTE